VGPLAPGGVIVKRRLPFLLFVALIGSLFAAGFLDHSQRSLVDWGDVRAVVIESDDWGLSGFVPDAAALEGLDRDALGGTKFPPIYWHSTLEDSADVAEMAQLLRGHVGRDGLPAVFQPNMIMGFRSYDPASGWRDGRLVDGWADGYERPGLWTAVRAAVQEGVWSPELHGLYHYDPADREARVRDSASDVAEAARRGVLIFPGAHMSFELGFGGRAEDSLALWRSMKQDLAELLGRSPVSVVAPDYVWGSRHERVWAEAGLRCVQGKRSQRRNDLDGPTTWRRIRKYAERKWDLWTVGDLVYLERNCRLETAQVPDGDAERLACAAQVRRAWRNGQPAVIEAHRVNYVLTDPGVEREGRDYLDLLLADIDADGPLYANDAELTGWIRRGVSLDRRGDRWIVRNPGPAARLAVMPTDPPTTLLVPPFTSLAVENHSIRAIDQISLH